LEGNSLYSGIAGNAYMLHTIYRTFAEIAADKEKEKAQGES
jgi:hypothetical protein